MRPVNSNYKSKSCAAGHGTGGGYVDEKEKKAGMFLENGGSFYDAFCSTSFLPDAVETDEPDTKISDLDLHDRRRGRHTEELQK